jgi:hypothetical protein
MPKNRVASSSGRSRAMTRRHIVIVGYDGITSLDLSGPLEAFSSASIEDSQGKRQVCYKVTIACPGCKDILLRVGIAHDGGVLPELAASP